LSGTGRGTRPGASERGSGNSAGERIQKVLSQLGLASRREAEAWIRAGRVTRNGHVALLGERFAPGDQLQLDGRAIRQRVPTTTPVLLCHRSPGQRLLSADSGEESFASQLPGRSGKRFMSVSPLPLMDGGLELLTADGAMAVRLQRAVRSQTMEFSLRLRGELEEPQQQALLAGVLDRGVTLKIESIDAAGGSAANRWYTLRAVGASGNDIRQLLERAGLTASRVLRTVLGSLKLERTLARGRSRELTATELDMLLNPGATTEANAATEEQHEVPGRAGLKPAAAERPANGRSRPGSRGPAAKGRRSRDSRVRRRH
jgi:23S rRNA pseudouridine2605 synthase